MRFSTRLCALLVFSLLCFSPQAQAASGLGLSIENLFAPLGKQVRELDPLPDDSAASKLTLGRETTEWLGLNGFLDLNINWRFLYGAHVTLLNQPLFKFDTSIAYMMQMPDKIPVQPYLFVGAVPVISLDNAFPQIGMNLQAGLGIDYSWNNQLLTQFRLSSYLLSLYGEEKNQALKLAWHPFSFSLSAGMGYLF